MCVHILWTNCFQNSELFGFASYDEALLEFPTLLFLKAFYGNIETPLLAVSASNHIYFRFSSSKVKKTAA